MLVVILSAIAIIAWSLTLRYKRRELQHKERLAAMDKGIALPPLTDVERRAPWSPRLYLLRGMIWLFMGIGATIFLAALSITSQRPRSAEERVRAATYLKQSGATDEQVRQVQNDTSPRNEPGIGIAFIGLIPIGVGAAYLIFYGMEGKHMAQEVARD